MKIPSDDTVQRPAVARTPTRLGHQAIPGTTKLKRLDENLGALAVELTPDDLREIAAAVLKITVQGARLPPAVLAMSGQ